MLRHPLGCTETEKLGYLALRRARCLECHELEYAGTRYGTEDHDAPRFDELLAERYAFSTFDAVLRDPEGELGTEDMPAFDYLPDVERAAIWAFLRKLVPEKQ